MLDEEVDDGTGVVHVVARIELEFLELRILPDEVLDGILQDRNEVFEGLPIGWILHVEHGLVLDSEFPGDRQGIPRGPSMGVVIDRDVRHPTSCAVWVDSTTPARPPPPWAAYPFAMPELPEVETTRRGLEPFLAGRTVVEAESRRPRMLRRQPRERDFADRMRNRRVEGLGRRGKFLLIDMAGDLTWVIHLGMSGRIEVKSPGDPETPHTNVVVRTARQEIRMVDPRTFGFMAVLTPEEFDQSPLALLGPDALNELPRSRDLAARFAARRPAIKTLLLDQRLVAGLGNIYADEVLHRARVAPHRPGESLSGEDIVAIRRSIRPVLEAGLRHGGTSLDDLAYLLPDGRAGEYTARLRVYGREGAPCRRCGTEIRRSVITQRSSFWCPSCQI